MTRSSFLKTFTLLSVGTAILLYALCQWSLLQPYLSFSFISLGLFMLLTLLMYFLGELTAKSSNKGLFTGMVMFTTFGKIFLSLIVVIGYYQTVHPSSKIFLLPFFVVYLIFTIFETYMMMQVGRQTKASVAK